MEEYNSNYDPMNRDIQQQSNPPHAQAQQQRPPAYGQPAGQGTSPPQQQPGQQYQQRQTYQPYGQPYQKAASTYRGAAIASLITGICSILFCWHLFFAWGLAIAGIITAIVYMSNRKDQRGMAIAGLVTSISGAVLSIIFIFIVMIFFTGMSSGSNYYDDYYDGYDYYDEYDYYQDDTL